MSIATAADEETRKPSRGWVSAWTIGHQRCLLCVPSAAAVDDWGPSGVVVGGSTAFRSMSIATSMVEGAGFRSISMGGATIGGAIVGVIVGATVGGEIVGGATIAGEVVMVSRLQTKGNNIS
jgi:hypothetical protein